jgi:hypothetical protein
MHNERTNLPSADATARANAILDAEAAGEAGKARGLLERAARECPEAVVAYVELRGALQTLREPVRTPDMTQRVLQRVFPDTADRDPNGSDMTGTSHKPRSVWRRAVPGPVLGACAAGAIVTAILIAMDKSAPRPIPAHPTPKLTRAIPSGTTTETEAQPLARSDRLLPEALLPGDTSRYDRGLASSWLQTSQSGYLAGGSAGDLQTGRRMLDGLGEPARLELRPEPVGGADPLVGFLKRAGERATFLHPSDGSRAEFVADRFYAADAPLLGGRSWGSWGNLWGGRRARGSGEGSANSPLLRLPESLADRQQP